MKTLYEQKANKCRHFNGMMNDTCEAGVKYDTVKVSRGEGRGYGLPCWKDCSEGCSCEKQSFRTDAEIKAEVEEADRHFRQTMDARKAIVEHLGPWKKGASGYSGDIDCPVCGTGVLRFTRSGYNGHIHANCSTAGCVAWME